MDFGLWAVSQDSLERIPPPEQKNPLCSAELWRLEEAKSAKGTTYVADKTKLRPKKSGSCNTNFVPRPSNHRVEDQSQAAQASPPSNPLSSHLR